jgi:secreted trypsin-like serine protease
MIAAALLASASVFHGTPVTPEQAPWLVTLTTRGPFCGGALIAPDRVLTAAHCVQGADPGHVSVRIRGVRHAWRGAYFPTSYREIPSPVHPEDASASGTVDDIAVIVLAKPVTGVGVLPVAQGAPVPGEASQTIGTGRTGPDGGGSGAARAAIQTVSDTCPAAYGARLFFADKHLCTLDGTANASQACAGDSGSPVMVQRNGAWAVAGVVTWGGETYGRDCGEGLPDVSERVDAHAALLTATGTFAPYAERRVRVRRSGRTRTCVVGAWHPGTATFTIRWWRRTGSKLTYLRGTGRTRTSGPAGCSVTAATAGGWAREDSYNQL